MKPDIIVFRSVLPITYLGVDNTVYIGDQYFTYQLLEVDYYDF